MGQAQKDTPRKGRKNNKRQTVTTSCSNSVMSTTKDPKRMNKKLTTHRMKKELHDTIGSGTGFEVPTQIHEALKMPVSDWPVAQEWGTKMARSAANFTTAIIKAIGRTKVLEEDEIIKPPYMESD